MPFGNAAVGNVVTMECFSEDNRVYCVPEFFLKIILEIIARRMFSRLDLRNRNQEPSVCFIRKWER